METNYKNPICESMFPTSTLARGGFNHPAGTRFLTRATAEVLPEAAIRSRPAGAAIQRRQDLAEKLGREMRFPGRSIGGTP
jgi:hypothetical protein